MKYLLPLNLLVISILFTLPSRSQESDSEWEITSTTNAWLKAQSTQIRNTPLAADSSPMATAKSTGGFLFQENLRLQKDKLQWIFRPSLEIKESLFSLYPLDGEKTRSTADARLNELYLQYNAHEQWLVALGLQNYQWGPAELMSPSNPLFHLFTNSQDPTFQMPGRNLMRLNFSPDGNWSVVSMLEVAKNEESEFISEQDFTFKKILKLERRLENPANYWGITAGVEQMSDPFVGAYGSGSFAETWSVYFDAKRTNISQRFQPVLKGPLNASMELVDENGKPASLAIIGLRYENEDYDCRYEWLSNELGFSDQEITLAGLSMIPQNPQSTQNQKRFLHNGRELPSQNYDYLSLRFNRFFSLKNLSFAIRALRSKRDDSSLVTYQWDGTWRDNWTFYLNAQLSPKNNTGELTMLYKNKINSGIKYTW